MAGATGNWYCGLHEVDDMGFVLHMLGPDDLFVDVGANIGSYTVMAAGAVGASVIAVEPLPTTFKKLHTNIAINGIAGKVDAHCLGLSSSSGEIVFTAGLDTMNRVALPGEALATVSVPVRTLDELTAGLNPRLIKIDVEGHEAAVLAGGSNTLSLPSLEAVLMETNGSGAKYGVSDESLMETMHGHGFEPYAYDALKREITPALYGSRNTIFIRNRRAAEARCKAADRYSLINGSI
jgi:FkbM family methyltransferase